MKLLFRPASFFILIMFYGHAPAALSEDRTLLADTERFLAVNFGAGGLGNGVNDFEQYGLEYLFKTVSKWTLRPAIGFIYGVNDISYVYVGLRRDFQVSDRWFATFGFDAGTFNDVEELELGNELEFHSSLQVGYLMPKLWRVAIGVSHLSNAGLGDVNPGTNSVTFRISVPF